MIREHLTKHQKDVDNQIVIAYLIVFSIILTPAIRIMDFPSIRLEQIIVFIYLLNLLLTKKMHIVIKNCNLKFAIMFLGFGVIILFSIFIGYIKGIDILFRDFLEIYKVIVYLSIYLVITHIATFKNNREKIFKFTIFCLLLSVIIAAQQYFNVFGLNEKYVPYIAPSQYKNLINNHRFPRSVGMTSNPNEYAILPGIGFICSWALFLKSKERKYILFLFFFLLGELMTLSRSGFLFLVLGFLFYTVFAIISHNLSKGRSKSQIVKSVLFTVSGLLLIGLIVFSLLPNELTWRLLQGLNISTDTSFQLRLQNWKEHIEVFKMSPIFGVGPGKAISFKHHVDNEWLMLLRRYGLFGTTYFIITFVFPFIKSVRSLYKYVYYSILIGAAIYMIPAIIYNSFQVMALIFLIVSLVPYSIKESYIFEGNEVQHFD